MSSWIGVNDGGKLSTTCYGLKLLESYPEEHESLLIFVEEICYFTLSKLRVKALLGTYKNVLLILSLVLFKALKLYDCAGHEFIELSESLDELIWNE